MDIPIKVSTDTLIGIVILDISVNKWTKEISGNNRELKIYIMIIGLW